MHILIFEFNRNLMYLIFIKIILQFYNQFMDNHLNISAVLSDNNLEKPKEEMSFSRTQADSAQKQITIQDHPHQDTRKDEIKAKQENPPVQDNIQKILIESQHETPKNQNEGEFQKNNQLPYQNQNQNNLIVPNLQNPEIINPQIEVNAPNSSTQNAPQHFSNLQWVQLPYQPYSPYYVIRSPRSRDCPYWIKTLIISGLIVGIMGALFLLVLHFNGGIKHKIPIFSKKQNEFRKIVDAIPSDQNQKLPEMPFKIHPSTKLVGIQFNKQYQNRSIQQKIKNTDIDSIVILRGSKTHCPKNQLLINGNCLICEESKEWVGSDCMPTKQKHLLRSDWTY